MQAQPSSDLTRLEQRGVTVWVEAGDHRPLEDSLPMPLESAAELLTHARRHRYAVGYFESWDLASLGGRDRRGRAEPRADHRRFQRGVSGTSRPCVAGPAGMVWGLGTRGGRIGPGPVRGHVQRMSGG